MKVPDVPGTRLAEAVSQHRLHPALELGILAQGDVGAGGIGEQNAEHYRWKATGQHSLRACEQPEAIAIALRQHEDVLSNCPFQMIRPIEGGGRGNKMQVGYALRQILHSLDGNECPDGETDPLHLPSTSDALDLRSQVPEIIIALQAWIRQKPIQTDDFRIALPCDLIEGINLRGRTRHPMKIEDQAATSGTHLLERQRY